MYGSAHSRRRLLPRYLTHPGRDDDARGRAGRATLPTSCGLPDSMAAGCSSGGQPCCCTTGVVHGGSSASFGPADMDDVERRAGRPASQTRAEPSVTLLAAVEGVMAAVLQFYDVRSDGRAVEWR